jgi:N-acylneuraminate cytidylyltransferase
VNVAIVPARGGSQRIPDKNIRDFCGRPMMAWSIEAARASGLFDRIIVSTDSPRVAQVARELGAETPFVRPAALADAHTPTIPVIRHAIDELGVAGERPELVCCLYATAPMMEPADLLRAQQLLRDDPQLDFAFSVTTFASRSFAPCKSKTSGFACFGPSMN